MSNADGCRRYRKMISLYADGLLPDDKHAELAEHVNGCRGCAAFLNGYTAMTGDLRRLPTAIPDAAFHAELMDGVQLMSQKSAFSRRVLNGAGPGQWLTGFCGAAAAVLVMLVSVSVLAAGINNILPKQNDAIQATLVNGADNDFAYSPQDVSMFSVAGFDATAADLATGGVTESAASFGNLEDAQFALRTVTDGQAEVAPQNENGPDLVTDLLFAGFENSDFMVENYWIMLETADINTAMNNIASIGVTVAASNVYSNGGSKGASVTLNALGGAEYAVETLSSQGTVINLSTSGYSQSQEITDALSNLTSKKSEYERLLSYVNRSSDLTGVILLQDRIYDVIDEIDYIEGRLRSMYKNAAYPTIYVSMLEKTPVQSTDKLAARLSEAFEDSVTNILNTSEDIVVSAAAVAAPAAIIALIVFAIWFLARAAKRTRRSGVNG